MPTYDLLLRGGTVIDGTGAPGRKADVAIRGDRIEAVAVGLADDHLDAVTRNNLLTAPLDLCDETGRVIGRFQPQEGPRVIDATGLVVAPGFIDTHNHSDGWLLKIPHLVSKTSQGFTTEVLASDGISYAPVEPGQAGEWLHYLRSLDGLQLADYRGWRSIADYMALPLPRTVAGRVHKASGPAGGGRHLRSLDRRKPG